MAVVLHGLKNLLSQFTGTVKNFLYSPDHYIMFIHKSSPKKAGRSAIANRPNDRTV